MKARLYKDMKAAIKAASRLKAQGFRTLVQHTKRGDRWYVTVPIQGGF